MDYLHHHFFLPLQMIMYKYQVVDCDTANNCLYLSLSTANALALTFTEDNI